MSSIHTVAIDTVESPLKRKLMRKNTSDGKRTVWSPCVIGMLLYNDVRCTVGKTCVYSLGLIPRRQRLSLHGNGSEGNKRLCVS